MTHIDINAAYGEERKQKRASPLALFINVIKAKPDVGEDKHGAAFDKLILREEHEEELAELLREWRSLKYNSAFQTAVPPTEEELKERVEERKKRQKEREAEAAKQAAETLTSILSLDFLMPNGKTLQQSTGAECLKAAEHHAYLKDNLVKVVEKVGKRRLVRDVLSAKELQ